MQWKRWKSFGKVRLTILICRYESLANKMNKIAGALRSRSLYKNGVLVRLASTNADQKVIIPKRIPRGPTDILRALESTVSRDPTAADYKYHDDPFLIPTSNITKRTYALAQESGRKAAHWVREQNTDLFQHEDADPLIKLYQSKAVYNENSEVSEEDLKNVIRDVLVTDAIMVYKLLSEKKLPISGETLQDLLDLLCFYNNEDTMPEEFIEERWYRQSARGKEKVRKTWKDGALAEEVFISMTDPTPEAYSSIIQGMAKYYQVDRAWQLYEEAQKKNIVLSTEAYNSIISVASFLKEGYDLRWTLVTDLLVSMNVAKVKPNLGTLNSVLEVISTMGTSKQNKQNALRTIMEFKRLGIEPSLASYYFLLITFCKERGPTSLILKDILPHIEHKEFKIRDIKDTYFFVTAMDVCRNHLSDKELAHRVHKLLHFGNNYDLIGDSYKESIYYRHFFILNCENEPINVFMENIYEKYVPHIYIPEPAVMEVILKSIQMDAATTYLPKLWSDLIVFDQTEREKLIELVLDIMMENVTPDEKLKQQFSDVAWNIFEKLENQNENRTQRVTYTGEMLGKVLTVLLRNNDFEKACQVLQRLDGGHQSILGVPQIETLSLFIDHCILQKQPSKAIKCIQYTADCGFPEAETLAVKLNEQMTLDEAHLSALGKIVGEHTLQTKIMKEPS